MVMAFLIVSQEKEQIWMLPFLKDYISDEDPGNL
jgi:hypothetical protein